MGAALGSIYIFFIGATGGALLAALLTDAFGVRTAILVLVIPSTIVGGLMILRSSTYIRNDLSLVVEELHEEMEEHQRQLQSPELIPALQVNDIDFAYGPVQVLFGVGFEVARGEVLALLGTNGAGKSTLLRVIAGLGTPSRGVVRLNGQTITYVAPEQRARLGVHMLPGGKGVFPQMTVRENLEMGAFIYRRDRDDMNARIDRVLSLFPRLSERAGQTAASLSGGEQQMVALARTLLHDPEVLIIDELSLGLAPLVVQELLKTIEQLKASGMTILIVEQSLNVALAIADRAVFLEKGEVRFAGPARELAERDDLAARGVPRARGRVAVVVVATWITKQLVFDGFVTGLVIGLLAMGIVLIYRSTRVINFAVGNMGLVGTALLAIMVVDHGVPFWLAVIACLAVGALYGALMEVAVIRRLFAAPRVIVLVATIGLAQLSLAVVVALPEIETVGAGYPVASNGQWTLLGIDVTGSQASIIVVVPIVAAAARRGSSTAP